MNRCKEVVTNSFIQFTNYPPQSIQYPPVIGDSIKVVFAASLFRPPEELEKLLVQPRGLPMLYMLYNK